MHVQRVESDNCLADVGNILEHLIFQVLQTFTFSNSMIDYDLYFSHHKRRVFLVFNLQPLKTRLICKFIDYVLLLTVIYW